ncbi:MAG: peptidoglycan DD-metalloendopeptidase family protein [Desulfobacteraceae bacterium]|nr:peptidoglycan DD-metalloendopeptidase family protein [Desulfobacteraceae bacterium]
MRSAPDLNAPVIRVFEKGAELRILQEDTQWIQVLHDGRIGYVYNNSRYLKRYTRHSVTEDETEVNRELAMARAKEIERRIKQKRKELRAVEEKQDAVAGDLEKIDRRLGKKRSDLKNLMAAVEEAGTRIHILEEKVDQVRAELARKKKYAGRRIVVLYKLSRLGEMNLLATADSVQQLFSRKAAIERVLEHDEAVIREMAEERQKLSGLLSGLQKKQEEKRRLVSRYEESLTELAEMRRERNAVLAGLERKKSDRKQTLAYLREAARRLDKTIKGLEKSYDKGGHDFDAHQGLLKMPVQGKIVSDFGRHVSSDSGAVNYRNGIEIRSKIGDPVRAVFAGEIVFADWVRGFGRVVIVSHGESYHTVYARVEEIFNDKGDAVESGQVIATVGESGPVNSPCLYFEIRRHGNPVDPMKWLDKG